MSDIEYITGRTYDECLGKLKSLYDDNFQIVKKRFVNKGGFLGFFQHEVVQVSYVVTEKIPSLFTTPVIRREPEKNFQEEKEKILGLSRKPDGSYLPAGISSVRSKDTDEDNPSYKKILDEMKSLREDISEIKINNPSEDEPDTIVKIRDILENNEFSAAFVREIIERIKRSFSLESLKDFEAVQNAVVKWIEESIQIDEKDIHEKAKIVILVGPTGVGKTTTVAKLAASYSPSARSMAIQKKVHIITIDNYRIAGKDQIEKYGEIMGISVDGCGNADEITAKVQKYAPEADMILIDTIGFSPRDCDNIAKMKATLSLQGYDTVVYLAMMASTKATDMREIMKQYEIFGYDDVIITKLDETGCIGNLISIVNEKGKKFAYYTTGQRVPADIEKASAAKLISMLRGLNTGKERQEQLFPFDKE